MIRSWRDAWLTPIGHRVRWVVNGLRGGYDSTLMFSARDEVLDPAGSIDAWRSAMDAAVVLGEAIVRRVCVFERSTRGIERVRAAYPSLADCIDALIAARLRELRANAAAAAVMIARIEDHIDSLEADAAATRGEFMSLDALKASLDL